MKASDLFVKCLLEEGIEYIFGIPGEENADFMISLEEIGENIKFILCRLKEVNSTGTNIITIEDPIEYQLRGISQIEVAKKKGGGSTLSQTIDIIRVVFRPSFQNSNE